MLASKMHRKDIVQRLISATKKSALSEWDTVRRQEKMLQNSLSFDESRLRGIKLCDLELDKEYLRHVRHNGDAEIKLFHDYPVASTARAFRRGKLVDLQLRNHERGFKSKEKGRWDSVRGIVSSISDSALYVQVSKIADNFLLQNLKPEGKISHCLVDVNQRSTSEILESSVKALTKLKVNKANQDIASSLTGGFDLDSNDKEIPRVMLDNFLDEDKLEALEMCSQKHPVTIIHGPPGTGKTTALAAVILSAVANGNKVLATAPSHAAVDALAVALLHQWNPNVLGVPNSKLLRVGNVLRLANPIVEDWLPRKSLTQDGLIQELQVVRGNLVEMSTKGHGHLIKEETELRRRLRDVSSADTKTSIKHASVVLSTCLTAMNWSSDVFNKFDLICIDEAAFAQDWLTLPLALSGIKRLVLSGDHCQLPPVMVHSDLSNATSQSLMETLIDQVPTARLTLQFRSNELISGWSSQFFYENTLKAHASVKDITLQDIVKQPKTINHSVLRQPMLFINTTGQDYLEDDNVSPDASISNHNEAFLVNILVEKYVKDLGVPASEIGIISPYWSQVALLRDLLGDYPVEISTVDGFQGCEKEFIILTFVRSNPEQNVGFLDEVRRVNVSITRAKRCCLIIGNVSTLGSNPGLASLIKYCSSHDIVIPVDDFIRDLGLN